MRMERVKRLFEDSGLAGLFEVKGVKDYTSQNYSAVRLVRNNYRIRAFEIWERPRLGNFCRIYHGDIASTLKAELDAHEGLIKSGTTSSDFQGDEEQLFKFFYDLLSSDTIKDVVEQCKVYARASIYEGLSLPDVDTSETEVLGAEFTWKDIIAILEDPNPESPLKQELSQPGVYLQRSSDGSARYVGSAYGEGGILGRWIKHLYSNGDAQHLNLYVLENGYNELVFTVLEFTSNEQARDAETRWKRTLGTRNCGPYDGLRLNRN